MSEGVKSVHVFTFLRVGVVYADLRPLLGQITWELALRVEATAAAMAKTGEKTPTLVVKKNAFYDNHGMSKSLDRKLASYNLTGVDHSAAHTTFATPTDKGIVCALPLQITLIHFPDNVATLCPPNVVPLQFCRNVGAIFVGGVIGKSLSFQKFPGWPHWIR